MMVSIFLGLIDEETGFMYFVNAEHPWGILYRDDQASFIGKNELFLRKVGMPKNKYNFLIETEQLKFNDVIFVGSDGRDDIRISKEVESPFINHDEHLFLPHDRRV